MPMSAIEGQMPESTSARDLRPMEALRQDGDLCVWRIAGASDRLIISMSSSGRLTDATPEPEFMSVAQKNSDTVLFISDPRRSWLNRPGIVEDIKSVIEAEAARVAATNIAILGHSMGGFSALVMPAFTRIDTAIAFSPQYSVDPAVVPDEKRWMNYREQIQAFRISNADDHLNTTTHYFLFNGRGPIEAPQRKLVRPRPNLEYYVLPGIRHNAAAKMKQAKVMGTILNACFSHRKRALRGIMSETFSARRVTPKKLISEGAA